MMKRTRLLFIFCCIILTASAQETFPVNGVQDYREGYIAFTHATIVKDSKTTLNDATLIIKQGKIISVGNNLAVPKDATSIDCKGKYIYPSFIDLISDYGITVAQQPQRTRDFYRAQFVSDTKGAYGWNQAIRPETDASKIFTANETKAKDLRGIGFGVVLSHLQDGIARGTGTLVTLSDEKENLDMLKDKAAAFYSFSKGSSTQDYPTSLMGSITLMRQTYLDAQWYKNLKPEEKQQSTREGTNLSLEAWNNNQMLPQIFDAGDAHCTPPFVTFIKMSSKFALVWRNSMTLKFLAINPPRMSHAADSSPDSSKWISFATSRAFSTCGVCKSSFNSSGF